MKTNAFVSSLRSFLFTTLLAAFFMPASAVRVPAQQPLSNSIEVERDAMKKLSFLVGHWSGPVTIVPSVGEPLHLTQTENVLYKLDGTVLLVEGNSASSDGKKVMFNALATIAYDDASHSYRFRAYHDGHYLDTELSVPTDGFSWGFTAGPAHILNTMHLTRKGEWEETTEVTVGGNVPHHSVEMLLERQR